MSTLMRLRLAADAVLLAHLAFILFVILGAAFAVRWRWVVAFHLPAAAWGIWVEFTGRVCPLTFLENHLRINAGESGYTESFIKHYLGAIIYPAGLTREVQVTFGVVAVIVNLAIYGWVFFRRRASLKRDASVSPDRHRIAG